MPRKPASDPSIEGPTATYPGSEYTADEAEFLKAMERFKRDHKRPFPTFVEALRVAKSLGYERAAVPTKQRTETA